MGTPKKLRVLRKQTRMGKPYAMYQLGLRYQMGWKVEEDLMEAIYWMGLAADAGYEPAKDWMEDMAFDDNASVQAWA